MTKLLSLLLLPFTIVLVQAVFQNAGENCGVKIWRVIRAREIRRHYEEIMPHHTYIILKDDSQRLVFYIVKLWSELRSNYVTLIRKQFGTGSYTLADIIGENKLPEKLLLFLPWGQQSNPLKIFQNCNQVPHLYASSRENNEVLEILIADGLTSTQDFILQCGSKALVFNVAGNVPVDQSKKLAAFITGNESKINIRIWSLEEELPRSFLKIFPHMLIPESCIEDPERTSSHFIYTRMWEYDSTEPHVNLKFITADLLAGPILRKLKSKNCYVLENIKISQATVFIGEKADFREITHCLMKAEELARTREVRWVSVVQKHTLTASFILVFKDVLEDFPRSLENPISYIMDPENSQ